MLIIKPKYLQETKSYLYNIFPKILIFYEMLPILDLTLIGTYSKKVINSIIWLYELTFNQLSSFVFSLLKYLEAIHTTGQLSDRSLVYEMISETSKFLEISQGAFQISVSAFADKVCNAAAFIFSDATSRWPLKIIFRNYY